MREKTALQAHHCEQGVQDALGRALPRMFLELTNGGQNRGQKQDQTSALGKVENAIDPN